MNRGKLDAVADALRLKDAEQRGVDVDGLVPFSMLSLPEAGRWSALAVAAIEAWAMPVAPAWPEEGEVIANSELEALMGCKLTAKVEYVGRGGRAFRRVPGGWEEYPEYPQAVTA